MRGKGEFNRLQGEIEELIDELWQVPRFSGLRRGFRPQIDVVRSNEPAQFRVVVELAGVEPKDVKLFADDHTLVIAGARQRTCAGRYHHMEIEYGPFQRRVTLGERIDPSAARAEYARGLLTIVLPVAQRHSVAAPVAIQVGSGS